MKSKLGIFSLFICALFAACAMQTVESQKIAENPSSEITNPKSNAVLVELFTSEGWSSCPAADRALAFLQKEQPVPQAEIIALAFHVDYWNRLGWRDEFSSPQFSARQADYASKFKLGSVYTPQMIVDGRFEFVGNNTGTATKNIFEAAKNEKAVLRIERKGENWALKAENLPKHDAVNVFLAIAEDGLSTKVEAGENRGRTLEHVAVVRELRELGRISANENSFQTEFQILANPNWKKENLRLVIFLHEIKSRQILGVLSVDR